MVERVNNEIIKVVRPCADATRFDYNMICRLQSIILQIPTDWPYRCWYYIPDRTIDELLLKKRKEREQESIAEAVTQLDSALKRHVLDHIMMNSFTLHQTKYQPVMEDLIDHTERWPHHHLFQRKTWHHPDSIRSVANISRGQIYWEYRSIGPLPSIDDTLIRKKKWE
jgi:hypothetical protein